jgi:hypothetical protein
MRFPNDCFTNYLAGVMPARKKPLSSEFIGNKPVLKNTEWRETK